MNTCPKCRSDAQQIKFGYTKSGSQRYRCKGCGHSYTPQPKISGYEESIRLQAVRMVADGINFRRAARLLGVSHQTVINWVKDYVAQLPTAPVPETVTIIEMDELFTFVGSKKTKSTS